MNIYTKIEDTNTQKAVALGLFDGVHLGHREVIKKVLECKDTLETVAFTFDTSSLKPTKKTTQKDITTVKNRLLLLEEIGLDSTYIIDFSHICKVTAIDFIHKVLHKSLHAKVVCCGSDFRFGEKAVGDVNLLKSECEKLGIEVHIADDIATCGKKISSTRIRELINAGEMEKVTKLLGRNYFIKEKVVTGKQLGRTIDCPTINQELYENLCMPKFGVYFSITIVNGVEYKSITNIGVKPTIEGERKPLAETHIIGINENLYGQEITVKLISFLREERKFNSVEELSQALKADIQKATEYEIE